MTSARQICAGILFAFAPMTLLAQQAGDRDPTFGTNGLVTTNITGDNNDEGQDVALQPDGKIVLAGYASFVEGGVGVTKFAVARYLPDGTLDPGFGTGGVVITPFEEGNALAKTVALQPDGGIIAAGYTITQVGNQTISTTALARYLPDGMLDTTFGGDGKVALDIGFGEVAELAVQPDTKIVAAAFGGLARFNADGTLDLSFGTNGLVDTTDFESFAVALQPDGRIVTAGVYTNPDPFERGVALARFLPNGSPDPTFGTGGLVNTRIGEESNAAAVTLQPDGRIVVAGFTLDPATGVSFMVARYLPDGALDASFAGDGVQTTNFGVTSAANDVKLQADGKIVASGLGGLARYLPDGSLDTGFGGDGIVNDFGGSGLAIQPDGKLVVGGAFNLTGNEGDFDFGVARYLGAQAGVGPPTSKEQCKKGGWRTFTIPRRFTSQGDCIDYVMSQ